MPPSSTLTHDTTFLLGQAASAGLLTGHERFLYPKLSGTDENQQWEFLLLFSLTVAGCGPSTRRDGVTSPFPRPQVHPHHGEDTVLGPRPAVFHSPLTALSWGLPSPLYS